MRDDLRRDLPEPIKIQDIKKGMGKTMEDKEIIDLFFARNENAIGKTDAKYGKRLTHLSANITGNEPDAQECVNDTYLAAWNTIPPTRPDNYFAYLCRIVRNISYKLFRHNTAQKRNAEMVSLTAELSEIIADPDGTHSEGSELGRLIDSFLETLDEDTQMIFVRRYFYADPLSHIASLTGMSENSIATRLFRARNKLKAHLEKEGYVI